MRPSPLHTVGSSLTVTGALAIGWALHRTLWVGDLPLAAPPAVGALVVGVALVVVGRLVELRYEPDVGGDEATETDDDEEFDPESSPVDPEWMEDHDSDET